MTIKQIFFRIFRRAKIKTPGISVDPSVIPNERTTTGIADRLYWLNVLTRLVEPVLTRLAEGRLKKEMPVEFPPEAPLDRRNYTHFEAAARVLAGISPWLELNSDSPEESALHQKYSALARQALNSATDPKSPDYLNFTKGLQPLVEAGLLAQAIVRAPSGLWKKLDYQTQKNLRIALISTRTIKPYFSNWLLFSAMVEAALYLIGEDWDKVRIDYALRQHEQWYKGDGIYGDGPNFHWDYYNSFVIHPMLVDVLRTMARVSQDWDNMSKNVMERARRYAVILERMISPEGTFPAIGRSLTYRFGVFHLLAQMALLHQLPKKITPAQVRCALTTVIRKIVEAPGTFDPKGWLKIGFCGHQPNMGEPYISTGSLYWCSVVLLPLGLPPKDEFWAAPPEDWTSRKLWSGQNMDADHAI
ncbi:MAG TPA: DUF2264 domain-containing protein [Thermodesulfobacteriota bacterium]|nr:DUF2264 domain-containing protein [Thermodesulfobacteriota bacterium]